MQKTKQRSFVYFLIFVACGLFAGQEPPAEALAVVPVVTDAQESFRSAFPHIRSLWLSGADYQGRPTRAAAYVGLPANASAEHPVPAVVCVHGGNGTIYADWVKHWNDAGYAAIAIDLEGHIPVPLDNTGRSWQKHEMGGPRNQAVFRDHAEAVEDQWMYHAITLVSRARNYLAELPEIRAEAIGVHGISWGGIVAGNTIGRDNKFAFAVLVYGCGYLDRMPNRYGAGFAAMPPAAAEAVRHNWDPASRMDTVSIPTFWLNWTHDAHFYLPQWSRTTQLLRGTVFRRIDPRMGHNHPRGYKPAEIVAFADQVLGKGAQLPLLHLERNDASGDYMLEWHSENPVGAVTLYETKGDDVSRWPEFQWTERTVGVSPADSLHGHLTFASAAGVTYCYANVQTADGLFVSTALISTENSDATDSAPR